LAFLTCQTRVPHRTRLPVKMVLAIRIALIDRTPRQPFASRSVCAVGQNAARTISAHS